MKLTKIMIAILTISSFMLVATASKQRPSKHARPSFINIISGWTQQLRRAGGAKFTRGLRDAGDNAGIAVVHRISKTGNAIATGVGRTYATACVFTDTSRNSITGFANTMHDCDASVISSIPKSASKLSTTSSAKLLRPS